MTSNAEPLDAGIITDASTISEAIREHETLRRILSEKIATLGDEHADQWVGIGPDQVLVFADTLDEITLKLKPDRNNNRTVVIEYLSSEQLELIL